LLLVSVVVAALMFLFVLPGRTYLAQRQSLASAQTRVKVLSDENARLGQEAAKLQTDAEIERRARQQYGLVKPGEQAFAILPSTAPPTAPAPKTPHHRGLLSRLWHDVQFWN
jgi:cell division protein FtsB